MLFRAAMKFRARENTSGGDFAQNNYMAGTNFQEYHGPGGARNPCGRHVCTHQPLLIHRAVAWACLKGHARAGRSRTSSQLSWKHSCRVTARVSLLAIGGPTRKMRTECVQGFGVGLGKCWQIPFLYAADADGSATLHSTGTLCVPELLVRAPATAA